MQWPPARARASPCPWPASRRSVVSRDGSPWVGCRRRAWPSSGVGPPPPAAAAFQSPPNALFVPDTESPTVRLAIRRPRLSPWPAHEAFPAGSPAKTDSHTAPVADDPLGLQPEHLIQFRLARLVSVIVLRRGCGMRETPVVVRQIFPPQILVGALIGPDLLSPQLLH